MMINGYRSQRLLRNLSGLFNQNFNFATLSRDGMFVFSKDEDFQLSGILD